MLNLAGLLRRRSAVKVRRVPEWLTLQEAAAYLKVTRNTVYRWCDLGLLPFFELKSGRGRRVRREDLDALLERGFPKEDGSHGTNTDAPA